jgi:hypothetical protein
VYPAVLLANFISSDVNCFYSCFLRVQISLPYTRTGKANTLYNLFLNISVLNKVGAQGCLEFPEFEKMLLVFVQYSFNFRKKRRLNKNTCYLLWHSPMRNWNEQSNMQGAETSVRQLEHRNVGIPTIISWNEVNIACALTRFRICLRNVCQEM